MAQSLVAYISQDSINANPNEHSPITSSPFGKEAAPVQGDGHERIEDSYEQRLEGGPVQPPMPADEYENRDEDLYEVSPKGKAALNAAKGSMKVVRVSNGRKTDIERGEVTHSAVDDTAAEEKRSASPRKSKAAAPVEHSAIAHDTHVAGHRASQKPGIATTRGLSLPSS